MQWKILNAEKLLCICVLTKNPGNRSKRFFSSPKCPDWLWGPPTLLFMGIRVKLLVCEVDRSPPSDAKIKNGCSCTSSCPTFFHTATACSGPEPPNYRGFLITLRHTTLSRTSLDKWSARCRDLWQHTTLTRDRHTCPRRDLTHIPSEWPHTHTSHHHHWVQWTRSVLLNLCETAAW